MKKFFKLLTILLLQVQMIWAISDSSTDPTGGVGGESGGNRLTWEQILKDPALLAQFPFFEIEGHTVRFDQLCLMGERIRTVSRFPINPNPYPHKEFQFLSTERISFREECTLMEGGVCRRWEMVEFVIPTYIEIEVYKKSKTGPSENWQLIFKKKFELTECETWR